MAEKSEKGTSGRSPRKQLDVGRELLSAIDDLRGAAVELFHDVTNPEAMREASRQAGRAMENAAGEVERTLERVSRAADPIAKQLLDASGPVAQSIAKEITQLTQRLRREVDLRTRAPSGDGRDGKGGEEPRQGDAPGAPRSGAVESTSASSSDTHTDSEAQPK